MDENMPELPTDAPELTIICRDLEALAVALLNENRRLRTLVSSGFARHKPEHIDHVPPKRSSNEDVA